VETMYKGLSEEIYELFKNTFEEKDWKTGYILKKMGDTSQEALYIGARFDDLYWQESEKLRKTHFYIRILNNGDKHTITFHGKNVVMKERALIDKITTFLRGKNQDILLYIGGLWMSTGEKSQNAFSILNAFKNEVEEMGKKEEEFRLPLVTNIFRLEPRMNEGTVALFAGSHEIAHFKTKREAEEWKKVQKEEETKMNGVFEIFIQTIKEKMKMENIRTKFGKYIVINEKDYIDVSVKKQYYAGKPKFQFRLDETKGKTDSVEKIKEKAVQIATKFSNTYRLRNITGQKK